MGRFACSLLKTGHVGTGSRLSAGFGSVEPNPARVTVPAADRSSSSMTREHLFFIPIVLSLGAIFGSQLTQYRWKRVASTVDAAPKVTLRSLLAVLVAFVALFVLTHAASVHGGAKAVESALGGQPLFDQRASFSAHDVYLRMSGFGEQGRAAYRRMTYTSDVAFPVVLFAFLLQLARFVAERAPQTKLRPLAFTLPGLWLLLDFAENAAIFRLLGAYPTRMDSLAGSLGFLTTAKFILLAASLVVIAAMSVSGPTAPFVGKGGRLRP